MPTRDVGLVSKFSGYLAKVKFCNLAFTLPVNDDTMSGCQLDIDMIGKKSGGWEGSDIVNFGVGGQPLKFSRSP